MALRDSIGRGLEVVWRFLLHNWHSLAATIAVLGFLISSFVPPESVHRRAYQISFLSLGMVAALLVLFEIKALLVGKEDSARFRTLRDAAPEIVKTIRDNISRGHKGLMELHILAGRIRTVADMMRGVLADIKNEYLVVADVKVTVYCFDPDFLVSWSAPTLNNPGFKERNQRYRQQVTSAIEDLMAFNDTPVAKSRRVSVDIVKYRTFPSFYALAIGDDCVYFGAFTWDPTTEDFEGPENPCFKIGKRDHAYADVRVYVENRAAFYRLSSTISYL